MAHGMRREPDELEKEHCSSLFSVPCNQHLSLRRLLNATLCDRTKAFPTSRLIDLIFYSNSPGS
jgi:hypothetical protein